MKKHTLGTCATKNPALVGPWERGLQQAGGSARFPVCWRSTVRSAVGVGIPPRQLLGKPQHNHISVRDALQWRNDTVNLAYRKFDRV